jgi:hypothetical protein
MAITYVGGTSGTSTSDGYSVSLTSLSGGSDSSPQTGDIVIVFTAYADNADSTASVSITGNNSGSYLGPDTGTAAATVYRDDTWDLVGRIGYQVMGATPDTSLTIGRVTDAVYGGGTVVHVYRGQDATTPIPTSSIWTTTTNSSRSFGAATGVASHDVLIFVGAGTQGSSGSAFTVPAEVTSGVISINADGTTSDIGIMIGYRTTTGSSGTSTWTGGASSNSSCATGRQIALRTASGNARSLTCSNGTYSLSGQAATFNKTISIASSNGSYSITGIAASLSREVSISCESGSYSISGQASTLVKGRSISCDSGAYDLSGQAATFSKTISLSSAYGTYSISGIAATLNKSQAITSDHGTYSISGQAATLIKGRLISCSNGTYSITGQSSTLNFSKAIQASAGSYSLSGQSATLNRSASISCAYGSYSINGYDAVLDASSARQLIAEHGLYSITGIDATFSVTNVDSNEKHGGDDVPIERWEKRKKAKKRDDELDRIVEENYLRITGQESPEEVVEQDVDSIEPNETMANAMPHKLPIEDAMAMAMAINGELRVNPPIIYKPAIIVQDDTASDDDDIEALLLLH